MAEAEEPTRSERIRRFNPGGLVYGALALATVIAAESTRRETFPKLAVASAVTIGLYWLAHAYAHHWGSRVQEEAQWSIAEIVDALKQEASMLVGAAIPATVLLIAWMAGAGIEDAVTAVLWSAGVELVALEIAVGVLRHFGVRDLAVQTVIGAGMGLGILVLRLVLH